MKYETWKAKYVHGTCNMKYETWKAKYVQVIIHVGLLFTCSHMLI